MTEVVETVASRVMRNTAIATGARVLSTALSFLVVALVARSLGVEAFGNYTLILSFLLTFQVFADGGLYTLLLRELSRPGTDEERVVGNILALRVTLLVVVLGAAPLLVSLLPYENAVPLGVAVGAVGFFFLSFSQMLMAVFQRELRLFPPALAEVLGRVAQLLAVVLVMAVRPSLFSFLLVLTVSAAVQWALNYLFARRIVSIRLRFDWDRWRHYLRETAPIAVSAVFVMIYFRVDSIFLSLSFVNRLSVSPLNDVGQYGIAYKIFEALVFYPSMFVGLLMPFFSRFALNQKERLLSVVNLGARALIAVALPAVIGLVFLAEPIVVLVGGPDFSPAAPLLRLLALALGFVFFGALYGQLLIALGAQVKAAWIYGLGAFLNIALNVVAIPLWQAVGAAATTVGTEVAVTIAMAVMASRFGVTVHWRNIPALIASSAGLIAVLVVFGGRIIPSIIVGGLVYGGLLVLLRGISREELRLLLGRRPTALSS